MASNKDESTTNDWVTLRSSDGDYYLGEVWEKIQEDENGWMKLRHYQSRLLLQLSEDGKNLSVRRNPNPCQGRKPCLRYKNNQMCQIRIWVG